MEKSSWKVRVVGAGPRIEIVDDTAPNVWLDVVAVTSAHNRARRDTADRFVRALNAHAGLVAALEKVRDIGANYGDGAPNSSACATVLLEVEDIARAALVAARGE